MCTPTDPPPAPTYMHACTQANIHNSRDTHTHTHTHTASTHTESISHSHTPTCSCCTWGKFVFDVNLYNLYFIDTVKAYPTINTHTDHLHTQTLPAHKFFLSGPFSHHDHHPCTSQPTHLLLPPTALHCASLSIPNKTVLLCALSLWVEDWISGWVQSDRHSILASPWLHQDKSTQCGISWLKTMQSHPC